MSQEVKERASRWIELAEERVKKRMAKIDAGEGDQLAWVSLSEWTMSLGRARFLHGAPLEQVREHFHQAARGYERVFALAYDSSFPGYLGSRAEPSATDETSAVDAFSAALMAAAFPLARRLASLVPASPTRASVQAELSGYVRGLKYLLLGEPEAARPHLSRALGSPGRSPPGGGHKRNYYTLVLALSGVLEQDDTRFNEGLRLQSEFYEGLAHGENADTDEEFLCDHLIALGNLGLHYGRHVFTESPFLPRALLLG